MKAMNKTSVTFWQVMGVWRICLMAKMIRCEAEMAMTIDRWMALLSGKKKHVAGERGLWTAKRARGEKI